jgi:hypothetical protein
MHSVPSTLLDNTNLAAEAWLHVQVAACAGSQ